MAKIQVIYATWSPYKREEVEAICAGFRLDTPEGDHRLVGELFDFTFRHVPMREVLVLDLVEMVRHKARAAYAELLVPCIVEHGGLIFEEHKEKSYPGGLTQPMWDALDATGVLKETGGAGRRVIARAVVGYCDGSGVTVFTGDTHGTLADAPRGRRGYYWDTVFQPDDPLASPSVAPRTYAEIADGPDGITLKVRLSQSTAAMLAFLKHRLAVGDATLFRGAHY
jgi:XTP/dITP diphosphohydrolase